MKFPLLLSTLLFVVRSVFCTTYTYNDVPINNLFLKYRSGFMFGSDSASVETKSVISFDFQLVLNLDSFQTDLDNYLVQVTILPAEAISSKSNKFDYERFLAESILCCADASISINNNVNNENGQNSISDQCFEKNILFNNDAANFPAVNFVNMDQSPKSADIESFYFYFENGDIEETGENKAFVIVDAQGVYEVKKSGLYVMMFSFCQEHANTVMISGHSSWKASYGHLPGDEYGFLNFYFYISIVYLVLAAIWGILALKNWTKLVMLQNYITLVLFLGMLEVNLRYFDFHSFNESGQRNHELMLFGFLFLAIKKAVSRMLVLLVSMGFGVVKEFLPIDEQNKVLYIGLAYFLLSFLYSTLSSATSNNDSLVTSNNPTSIAFVFGVLKIIIEAPLAAVDIYFFYLTIMNLNSTLMSLEKRNKPLKLGLYNNFKRVLLMNISLAMIWLVFGYIAKANMNKLGYGMINWQNWWMLEAGWDVFYLSLLMGIMFLWRPNENSGKYSYLYNSKRDEDLDYKPEEYDENLPEELDEERERLNGDN